MSQHHHRVTVTYHLHYKETTKIMVTIKATNESVKTNPHFFKHQIELVKPSNLNYHQQEHLEVIQLIWLFNKMKNNNKYCSKHIKKKLMKRKN